MTTSQAQTAVTTASLVCGGMYVYRKVTEAATGTPSAARPTPRTAGEGVIGLGEVLPVGTFITGWGVTFITLSILTSINADLGGSLAVLVAVGAALGNGMAVASDVQQGLHGKPLKAPTAFGSEPRDGQLGKQAPESRLGRQGQLRG